MSKYKVSFEVEGDDIVDDMPLTKDNLEDAIMSSFDVSGAYGRGGPYSSVSNLKVEEIKMKGGAHNGTIEEKSEGGSEGRSCC